MKRVLIIGAGRLGKGFVGETFDNAGWDITFLDKDQRVIDEIAPEEISIGDYVLTRWRTSSNGINRFCK